MSSVRVQRAEEEQGDDSWPLEWLVGAAAAAVALACLLVLAAVVAWRRRALARAKAAADAGPDELSEHGVPPGYELPTEFKDMPQYQVAAGFVDTVGQDMSYAVPQDALEGRPRLPSFRERAESMLEMVSLKKKMKTIAENGQNTLTSTDEDEDGWHDEPRVTTPEVITSAIKHGPAPRLLLNLAQTPAAATQLQPPPPAQRPVSPLYEVMN